MDKRDQHIDELKSENIELLKELNKEQRRIIGLSSLVQPLTTYSQLNDMVLSQETAQLRHFLHNLLSSATSHNYSNIFSSSVLKDLNDIVLSKEKRHFSNHINFQLEMHKIVQTGYQITADWIRNITRNVGNHLEVSTGKSLNMFLPMATNFETLSELRDGKNLARVVVCLIVDQSKQVSGAKSNSSNNHLSTNSFDGSLINKRASSCAPEHTAAPKKTNHGQSMHVMSNHSTKQINNPNKSFHKSAKDLSLEELSELRDLAENPKELIRATLRIATKFLDLPLFRSLDIYAGKTDVIFSLLTHLMMNSSPTINAKDSAELNQQVDKLTKISMRFEKYIERKRSIEHLHKILHCRAVHLGQHEYSNDELEKLKKMSGSIDENEDFKEVGTGDINDIMDRSNSQNPSHVNLENSDQTAKLIDSQSAAAQVKEEEAIQQDPTQTYQHLVSAIDHFIDYHEETLVLDLVKESVALTDSCIELQHARSNIRHSMDEGIRLTNELRKFVVATNMENSLRKFDLLAADLDDI